MARRGVGIVLFVLLIAALLAPLYNIFQPFEHTTPFTDTEFQVAALAFVAGLFVVVALLLMHALRLVPRRSHAVPLPAPVFMGREMPIGSAVPDSPPQQLSPLRI